MSMSPFPSLQSLNVKFMILLDIDNIKDIHSRRDLICVHAFMHYQLLLNVLLFMYYPFYHALLLFWPEHSCIIC